MSIQSIFRLILSARRILLCKWWNFSGKILLKLHGVLIGKSLEFHGHPIISNYPQSKIVIGDKVVLCSDATFTALGVSRPVILRTMTANAQIKIGADTGMSGTVICSAISVTIGSQCLIGADVQIFDTDFHKVDPVNRRHHSNYENIACEQVEISDNVFIGAGTKILKGVSIGRNSIIGAGSVVTKSIPANCIAAGNPAKVISELPLVTSS
jgi:acetyltransferase-like isoleucine patch superfamily enzyme